MQTEELTVQVTSSHFCAGVVVKDGIITKAAPILKWAKNKEFTDFSHYCASKGWVLEVSKPSEVSGNT